MTPKSALMPELRTRLVLGADATVGSGGAVTLHADGSPPIPTVLLAETGGWQDVGPYFAFLATLKLHYRRPCRSSLLASVH